MRDSFQDKVVFLTGASSGIGAALARELAARGAHLSLCARRADRLEALKVELEAAGTRVLALPCDVTRVQDVVSVAQATREKLGPIDIVIANAGFGVVGKFEKLTLEDYARQFETNVYGAMRAVAATLGDLKKTRGRIGLVGSVNGYVALPGNSPYCMSKFALRAFADSLRGELASSGVSVTYIAPGFVESEIRKVDNRGVLHPGARDKVPTWLQMPAAKAARQIGEALLRRRREAVITRHGKAAVWLQRHLPGALHLALSASGLSARAEP